MSFRWQDKHMELFLETYKNYECLWNNKCNDYSKSHMREVAYTRMLRDLNIPELTISDIKAKIKTIRTRYVAELAKVRSSEVESIENPGDPIYEPRLFWFKDADSFLRKVCTSKSKYSMMKDQEVPEKGISFETVKIDSQYYEDNDSTSQENTRHSLPVMSPSYTTTSELATQKNLSKRFLPNDYSVLNNTIKKPKIVCSEYNNQDPNEFDVYCQSLAIQLKKMPLHRAIICQEKLQKVMTQERLFQLTEFYDSSNNRQAQNLTSIPMKRRRCDSVEELESRNNQLPDGDDNSDFISEIKWET